MIVCLLRLIIIVLCIVSVPPEKPVVVDRWGRVINSTTLGPHEEGDDVLLTCRVLGGMFGRGSSGSTSLKRTHTRINDAG